MQLRCFRSKSQIDSGYELKKDAIWFVLLIPMEKFLKIMFGSESMVKTASKSLN